MVQFLICACRPQIYVFKNHVSLDCELHLATACSFYILRIVTYLLSTYQLLFCNLPCWLLVGSPLAVVKPRTACRICVYFFKSFYETSFCPYLSISSHIILTNTWLCQKGNLGLNVCRRFVAHIFFQPNPLQGQNNSGQGRSCTILSMTQFVICDNPFFNRGVPTIVKPPTLNTYCTYCYTL